jgi:hypothetical protein
MALASVAQYASFDLTDGSQIRDISPLLQEALYYDLHLLGNLNMAMDNPVEDIIYYWNEDALNADTTTTTISAASGDTSLTVSTSAVAHIGDLAYVTSAQGTLAEVMQVTAINSATNVAVTRGYNSTSAGSIANGATVAFIRAEQEFSDIGTDVSINPTVRTNYTQIISGKFDVQISGSQLERRMATSALQDQVAHQLANRMTEWKINFTRALLYGEKVGPGSDTQYRSFGGARYWIKSASGQTNTTAGALSLSTLNSVNKSIVTLGAYPDILVIGPDLVDSVNSIDASNRRLLESDTKAGYMVNKILLGQGNAVDVVVDARVSTGDCFLLCKDRVKPRPYGRRGLFTLQGSDWLDGKKRRILGEWGIEFRNPSVHAYLSNKS